MLQVMSDRFDLWPTPVVDPTPAGTDTWRRAATSLRLAAAEVGVLAHDLAAYHRTDVWQGAVATGFGDELGHWRTRLSSDQELGLGTELRALADQLDARARVAELGLGDATGGAISGLWVRPPTPGPT